MDNNANKIILGVAVALTVAVLALVIGSGGSRGGSGGGAPAAQAPEQQQTEEQTVETTPENTPTPTTATPTTDYDPSAERQMTLDELEQELSKNTVEVGENPRDAATSTSVPTTQEVSKQKADRGFGDLELIVDFDINGGYVDPHVVDASSADKYPSYKMLYASSSGVIWTIYVNEGNYLAIPLGAQGQQLSKEIILTESDVVTQYDAQRNQFSDFPVTTLIDEVGVHVDRVDAQTLDSYTIQTLAAM